MRALSGWADRVGLRPVVRLLLLQQLLLLHLPLPGVTLALGLE